MCKSLCRFFSHPSPKLCRHGLPKPSRLRARPAGEGPVARHRRAGRSQPGNGRGPAAALPRRRAGGVVYQSHRRHLPHAGQPLRHHGADALLVSRHAGDGPPAGGLAGRSVGSAAAAAAVSEGAVDGVECPAPAGVARAGADPADDHRPAAAVEVLARRRRPLHHPAPGLHRGSRAAGPGALEPGDVPRAARRRAIRRQSRSRPALPVAARHRRTPCRRHPPQGAAAGEHLRGRAARHDRCRRDAPARGHQRVGLRRHPGGAACP